MTDFATVARAHGLLIRDLRADGRIHRCPTENHPRAKNGAYRFNGDWGWFQDWSTHAEPIVWRAERPVESIARIDRGQAMRAERERAQRAARRAAEVIERSRYAPHPYLDAKGFENEQALVDIDGRMVVPMRDARDARRINSVQWIAACGEKRFLPGGVAKGSVYAIGAGSEQWLCEGYATALSIRAALKVLYRSARVVVCFSAGNLAHVAGEMRGVRFVVADNDASATGQRAAESTGLPWVMPETVGHDANDLHRTQGVYALAALLRRVLTT